MYWSVLLKPILIKKIEEAINETNNKLGSNEPFPWIGEDCYDIMADAAIAILRGMQDSQQYLIKEGLMEP